LLTLALRQTVRGSEAAVNVRARSSSLLGKAAWIHATGVGSVVADPLRHRLDQVVVESPVRRVVPRREQLRVGSDLFERPQLRLQ